MGWKPNAKEIKAHFSSNLDAARIQKIAHYFNNKPRPNSFEECGAYRLSFGNVILTDAMFTRAEEILPSMLEMVAPILPMDLMRFVNGVLVASVLTKFASNGRRQRISEKQQAETLTKFSELVFEIEGLAGENTSLGSAISIAEAELELHFGNLPNFGFGEGPIVIRSLRLIAKILETDQKIGGEAGRFFVPSKTTSKPKLNSVEKAAYLCRRFGGPAFVTTPSSDFSLFACLLHEIATGDRDESMQGAIVAFSQGKMPTIPADDGDQLDKFDFEEFEDWQEAYHRHHAKIATHILDQVKDRSLEKILLLKMEMNHQSKAARIILSRRSRQKLSESEEN